MSAALLDWLTAGAGLAAGGATPGADLLAWAPFVNPITLPTSARLWMFPPLALFIAMVYRASRARSTDGMLRGTLITFANIVVGMWLIAIGVYVVHMLALRLTN